jgi:hypothetical protein
MIQLEFFETDEIQLLKQEIINLKNSNEKVRRALFARHGELAKNYVDLVARLEIIERNICRKD